MPAKALSRAEAQKTARAINRAKGARWEAATALGISESSLFRRARTIKIKFPDIVIMAPTTHAPNKLPASVMQETLDAVARAGGNVVEASRATGINRETLRSRMREAEREGFKPKGRVAAQRARVLGLPPEGEVWRYLIAAAQNDTRLHEPTWSAGLALQAHWNAKILVSSLTYIHKLQGAAKRNTEIADDKGWYDPRLTPFMSDEMLQLAPGLVFNGHLQLSPTAVDPLSGFDSYNGRNSGVFPHTKTALKSIATTSGSPAKLQFTTGAVTQLNYIQRKSGQKAEFHHTLGFLLVEVNSAGNWWVRQLSTDSKGRMYDAKLVAMPSEDGHVVVPALPPAALVFGDAHVAQLEEHHRENMLAMVDTLTPDLVVVHDGLDMESRGHHNRRDPHKMFELHARGRESVQREITEFGGFLADMAARSRVLVVDDNHGRHLDRWLKEAEWQRDPVNAEFYLAASGAWLATIRKGEKFQPVKWAVGAYAPVKGVKFLEPGGSHVVCRDASGGIELGLHGDLGPNGSRGSVRNLSRLGRKVVIGHSHSAAIFEGAYQTGVSAKLGMDYAVGAPSSWSHSDCLVLRNGKRQILTWWGSQWCA